MSGFIELKSTILDSWHIILLKYQNRMLFSCCNVSLIAFHTLYFDF